MTNMEDADWGHLGECLREARAGESREHIAKLAGVSRAQIQRYEEGRVHSVIPDKLYKLAKYYRWAPGSVRKVLAGGEPEYLPDLPSAPPLTPAMRADVQRMAEQHPTWTEQQKLDFVRWLAPEN